MGMMISFFMGLGLVEMVVPVEVVVPAVPVDLVEVVVPVDLVVPVD